MNIWKTLTCILVLTAVCSTWMPPSAQAHCQIPCGIYDDHARVQAMLEDTATIEKAIRMMTMLDGKTDVQSRNQLVRWVNNKEEHAEKIIGTISNYFLTQRVKPSQEDYVDRLAKHHAVMLAAMKCKQTSSLEKVEDLKAAVKALQAYYPAPDHHHDH